MLLFSLSIWEACLRILSRFLCDSDFSAKCLNEIWLLVINVGLNETGNSEMQCVSHAKSCKSIISTTLCIYNGKKKCVSWIAVFLLGTDALWLSHIPHDLFLVNMVEGYPTVKHTVFLPLSGNTFSPRGDFMP